MPFAQIDDLSIYYKIQGDSGSPVILITGFSASHVEWPTPTLGKLLTQHQLILFDNRGVGQTSFSAEPYTMSQLATDTVGLLDALHFDKVHVVGLSMGGMIAQHIALNYPDKVNGLVLGCTSAGKTGQPILVQPSAEVLRILEETSSVNRAQSIRKNWSICYTPTFFESHQALLEERLQAILAYPAPPDDTYQLQMQAMMQSHDTFSRLSTITHPTLVQTGLEDKVIPPKNSRILAECLTDVQLIEYPNAAHSYLEETNLVAAEDILTFLERVETEC